MLIVENKKLNYFFYKKSFKIIDFFSPKYIDIKFLRIFLVRLLDRLHNKELKEKSKIIYSGKMPDVSAWFDYESVFPLKKMIFEEKAFFVPNNAKHYLENIYSFDYMELPPLEKRTVHAYKVMIH